jgi:hypothetical protein
MIALVIGFIVFLIGIVADIQGTNRRLQEEALYFLKRAAFSQEPKGEKSRSVSEVS